MIEEIRQIMEDKKKKDFSDIDEDVSLFSSAVGIKARDVLCLFLEIEKRYGVIIDADKINDPNFFTLKAIAVEIEQNKFFIRG